MGIAAFTHWDGHARNAAQLAGPAASGDRILSIDGRVVKRRHARWSRPSTTTPATTLTLVVERHGRDLTLHATPVDGRTLKVNGAPLATGVHAPGLHRRRRSRPSVVHASLLRGGPLAVRPGRLDDRHLAAHAMVHVFSPGQFSSLFHQVAVAGGRQQPVGPVDAARVDRRGGAHRRPGAQAGAGTLLEILMTVNIFVGLLNMLPMLPLDGGLRGGGDLRAPAQPTRRGATTPTSTAWRPLAYGFMTVLVVLFACTLYLDIAHPIANPVPASPRRLGGPGGTAEW